jgi:hypothetical protein
MELDCFQSTFLVLDSKRAIIVVVGGASCGHITKPLLIANPEIVDGMLHGVGNLLKLLDVLSH